MPCLIICLKILLYVLEKRCNCAISFRTLFVALCVGHLGFGSHLGFLEKGPTPIIISSSNLMFLNQCYKTKLNYENFINHSIFPIFGGHLEFWRPY